MNYLLTSDIKRYQNNKIYAFQKYFRKCQESTNIIMKKFYKGIYYVLAKKNHIEISTNTSIGAGLYFGHPFCITINSNTVIGCNCNLHKGVTIGQENRGKRKGTPIIGNSVWIGINSTIVGNIIIGDDVMIAPNTYINCDIPSHSIVFGNPCVIKRRDNATKDYINRKCDLC